MSRFTRLRPSPAMLVACAALFVALGGVGYAAATIGSAQIKNNSIRSKDIRNSQVYTQDIRNSTVRGKDVRNGNLTGADVKNDSLEGADILESSLGKVPSAASADNANTANTAGGVSFIARKGVTTVNEGGSVVLFTYGPFTIRGNCNAVAATTQLTVTISTTEDNSAYAARATNDGSFGPADGEQVVQTQTDPAGGDPTTTFGFDDQFMAFAPSGRALNGTVSGLANTDAGTSGECKFFGNNIAEG